nr:hypothetical protein 6 [Bacillaceae bacterium]
MIRRPPRSTLSPSSAASDVYKRQDYNISITTDTQTGCRYLIFDGDRRGGITPLLKSDGTPDCQ